MLRCVTLIRYLLCCVSVLGQYRLPIVEYWRGLVVMLVAYEVQYQLLVMWEGQHDRDNMDFASSNAGGAIAAVFAASILKWLVDSLSAHYYARLLHRYPHPLCLSAMRFPRTAKFQCGLMCPPQVCVFLCKWACTLLIAPQVHLSGPRRVC